MTSARQSLRVSICSAELNYNSAAFPDERESAARQRKDPI